MFKNTSQSPSRPANMTKAACVLLQILTTLVVLHQGWVDSAPLISAPWGQISGVDAMGAKGAPYSFYQAIPYALPPVRERRFAKPVPHPGPGAGRVFNASTPGHICPQTMDLKNVNEDCLTLNVFVPTSASSNTGPKSVMVWIHGGGFTFGSALEYIPSELISNHDVIVVVIQYRLGVLGFLSSGNGVISGNYGLWDQTLAIKWVKDNIQAFGGDPNSMTLFGESAGAASVGYQMLTPATREINFRVILQSGTPLSPFALNPKPENAFYALANKTGCLYTGGWMDDIYNFVSGDRLKAQHEQVLKCLRGKDAKTLIQAVPFLPVPDDGISVSGLSIWVPTVDGDFIPRAPADLLRDVNYLNDVGATSRDVMIGVNNDEGSILLGTKEYIQEITSDEDEESRALREAFSMDEKLVKSLLADDLMYNYGKALGSDSKSLETIVNVLDFFYTKPLNGGQVQTQNIVDIVSDTYFVVPTIKFMMALTKASDTLRSLGRTSGAGGRRYLYHFNHYPASKAGLAEVNGMDHAEDLMYEFDSIIYFDASNFNSDDVALAVTFKSMIANFAKNGDPQLNLDRQVGGFWPEFTTGEQKYLSLEITPRVQDHLYSKRVALWVDLVPSLVNSTRSISRNQWQMPWQWQSQNSCQNGYGYYNCNGMSRVPMSIHIKGHIRFFKLH